MVFVADTKSRDDSSRAGAVGVVSLNHLATSVQERVFPFIRRAVGDHHAAEDILQETLLTMTEQMPRLRRRESLWPWIYRVVRSKIQDHFRVCLQRDGRRRALASGPMVQIRPLARESEPLQRVLFEESLEQVASSLTQLNDRSRMVVYLRCYEQMPYTAIAARTCGTPGQARTLFHRATRCLRSLAGPSASQRDGTPHIGRNR